MHGTKALSISAIREIYGLETISLRDENRFYFLNTFFSVSEANMYLQVSTVLKHLSLLRSSWLISLIEVKLNDMEECLTVSCTSKFPRHFSGHMWKEC